MGDISELRGLILCVTFLGSLTLLIGWMPVELYTASEGKVVEVPSFYEAIDTYSFADSADTPMNETLGWTYPLDNTWYVVEPDDDATGNKEIGGHDVEMFYKKANESGLAVKHQHLYGALIFTFAHWQNHYDRNGVNRGETLTVEEIQANSENNQTSKFKVGCIHFNMIAIYNFNYTKWGTFANAWNMHELYVYHGVNFDQVNTAFNAFDLISMLLFFQLPEMNLYVNALLAIPMWCCIAYLVYVLLIKVIPFIAGG